MHTRHASVTSYFAAAAGQRSVQRDTFLASCSIEDVVSSVLRLPLRRLMFLSGTEFEHTLRQGLRSLVDLLDSGQIEVEVVTPSHPKGW